MTKKRTKKTEQSVVFSLIFFYFSDYFLSEIACLRSVFCLSPDQYAGQRKQKTKRICQLSMSAVNTKL